MKKELFKEEIIFLTKDPRYIDEVEDKFIPNVEIRSEKDLGARHEIMFCPFCGVKIVINEKPTNNRKF